MVHAQPNNPQREDRQIVYDTPIVVVGNVLTAPEWRRTIKSNTLVANFRVASTSRRYDKDNNRWVDGDTLRVRVNCWRRLAENVGASVAVGDPIVVVGRLYTRDWTDSDNNPRTSYEMEAVAVGHDLARGKSRFFRNRPALPTSAAEGPESEGLVRGEAATVVTEDEVPIAYGEGVPYAEVPAFGDVPPRVPDGGAVGMPDSLDPVAPAAALDPESEPSADPQAEDIEVEGPDQPASVRRTRRNTRRQPVPA
jgi:single-strand DNA-binding protein